MCLFEAVIDEIVSFCIACQVDLWIEYETNVLFILSTFQWIQMAKKYSSTQYVYPLQIYNDSFNELAENEEKSSIISTIESLHLCCDSKYWNYKVNKDLLCQNCCWKEYPWYDSLEKRNFFSTLRGKFKLNWITLLKISNSAKIVKQICLIKEFQQHEGVLGFHLLI